MDKKMLLMVLFYCLVLGGLIVYMFKSDAGYSKEQRIIMKERNEARSIWLERNRIEKVEKERLESLKMPEERLMERQISVQQQQADSLKTIETLKILEFIFK